MRKRLNNIYGESIAYMNIRFIKIAKIGCGGYQYYFKISFNNQLFQIFSFYLVERKNKIG